MAGLLDYIGQNGGALGAYLKQLDDMSRPFVPSNMQPQNVPALIDLPSLFGRVDRWTGDRMGLGGPTPQQPNGPAGGGDMADWYRGAPVSNAAASVGTGANGAANAMTADPSWAQPPMQAQQAFNMPTSTYAFGGQMVPAFGQPQSPVDEVSARPRGPAPVPVNAPQAQAPSYQSELLNNSPSTSADNYFKFFDRFRPDYADRREATKAQSETARGAYEVFRAQGMTPNEAAARAVIAARNPEVLKEQMGRFKDMEQRLANQPSGAGGGANDYYDHLSKKTAAEELAKKRADAQSGRETLQLELPGLTADAQEHLRQVEALRNHPGRKGNPFWHSKLGGYLPDSAIPGNTDAGDAVNRLNGIKGGAFLEAFKSLKGGGQITEIEGKKATDAIARMNRATSEAEFNAALDDYAGAIKRGVDKLNATAGLPPPGNFKGNDGWQTLPGGVKIRPKQ